MTSMLLASVHLGGCGRGPRAAVVDAGALAVATGLAMFVVPAWAIDVWPWPLTPLTCRVVGATFCLGTAGLGTLWDDRWEAVRLMQRVQLVMFALTLVAVVRARAEFFGDRPLTWVMGAGFLAVFHSSEREQLTLTQAASHAGASAP